MKISRFLTLAVVCVALAACKPKGAGAADGDGKDAGLQPVAVVNGQTITRSTFDFYVQAATGQPSSALNAEQKQQALDALIRLQLVAAKAEKDGLAKGETAAAIELSKLDALQRAATEAYLKDKTPTDQDLQAEYDTQVAQLPRNEYRARHILVQTKDFADQILARLAKGEKFETLAKDSLDSSRDKGGDLGWFGPQAMVKPFSDAVMALKKGETTAKPVQTQFGWHIIRLDDVRDVQPPPFEQVKPQLGQVVLAKKFRAYGDELAKAAKIEKKLQ